MCALICSASRIFLTLFRENYRTSDSAFHQEHLIVSRTAICITKIIILNSGVYIGLHNCGSSTNDIYYFAFISDRFWISACYFLRQGSTEKM